VRFVYVDESGISVNESVIIVAGVIINADLQWESVERRVEEIVSEYVLPQDQEHFVFHAKDLFHGSGKVFGNRNKYPLTRSREALRKIAGIPMQLGLPIVCGHLRKRPVARLTKQGRRHEASKNHMLAFSFCTLAAERYMREQTLISEIATLVAENNNDTRRAVKSMHDLLRGRDTLKSPNSDRMFDSLSEMAIGCLPIRRIKDTVYFAEKADAILPQIADACALIFRYFYEGKPNIDEFLDALTNSNRSVLGSADKRGGYLTLAPRE